MSGFDIESIVLMVLAAIATMATGYVALAVRSGRKVLHDYVKGTNTQIDDRLYDIVFGGVKDAILDADGDGVADDNDAHPHDPARS